MNANDRPRRVALAVWLYVISIALGILASLLFPVPGPLWFTAVIAVLMLLLAFALWQRRNWSRIVLLVLFLIGLPGMFAVRDLLAQRAALSVAILVAQTLLQAAAVVLLFTGDSGAWYRPKAEGRKAAAVGS